MKKALLKRAAAVALAVLTVSGAVPAEPIAQLVKDISITAKADPAPVASFENGVLTLYGEVTNEAIDAYRDNDSVKKIVAANGTVLPGNCDNLFFGFYSVTEIDLSRANTSNVNSMSYMFSNCKALKIIDLSSFDTSSVESMTGMFFNCNSLTTLDLSDFDIKNVYSMESMFSGCSDLTTIKVSDKWNTKGVTQSNNMFLSCDKLNGGSGTKYNAFNTSIDYACIDDPDNGRPGYLTACKSAELIGDKLVLRGEVNVDEVHTDENKAAVKRVYAVKGCIFPKFSDEMFKDFALLEEADLKNVDTSGVSWMSEMFSGCSSVKMLDLSNFDTSDCWTISRMFYGCSELTQLDITGFDTSDVGVMNYMFQYCGKLKTIYVSTGWQINYECFDYDMFTGCDALVGSNGTKYTENHDHGTYACIDREGTPGYFTGVYKAAVTTINGKAAINKTERLFKGDEMTLSITPDKDYVIKSVTVNEKPISIGEGNVCVFTMPDDDADIAVTCVPAYYTITWKNEDGTVLKTEQVAYGVTPSYTGDKLTKAGAAEYTYSFAGWSPEIKAAEADTEYTAVFDCVLNKYTIKFVDEDGTTLQESEVEYGTKPAYTADEPTKAADAQYTYTFAGWDKEISEVTGETTYTATYNKTLNKHVVIFADEDGTVLQESEAEYGTMPEYKGEEPAKAKTAENSFAFAGWDKTVAEVTGDATYKATYSSTANPYTITYTVDGKEYKTETLTYGTEIKLIAEPTKAGYAFSGWKSAYKIMPAVDIEITGGFAIDKTTLTHVEAKEPTYTDEGNTEYWYSEILDKYFADENGENEISRDDTVVAKLIKLRIPGDANGDGVLNVMDATTIAQYLAGWNVNIDLEQADVDGDGNVTVKDLTLIKQSLAHWNVTLK